ncbi:hypothetical protein YC2023_006522 [Brassica napus]
MIQEALDMIGKHQPLRSSIVAKQEEHASGSIEHHHHNLSPSDASKPMANNDSISQNGSEKKEAQMPSELITSCVATWIMIQMCTERQYPPAYVAQLMDTAVTSLQPRCPQNLPIYREIQMCMGRIKTQIMSLQKIRQANGLQNIECCFPTLRFYHQEALVKHRLVGKRVTPVDYKCCKLSLFQTYVYLLPNKILLGGNVLSYLLSEKHVDQRLFLILSEKHVNAIRLLTDGKLGTGPRAWPVRVWCGAGLGLRIHDPQKSGLCGMELARYRVESGTARNNRGKTQMNR